MLQSGMAKVNKQFKKKTPWELKQTSVNFVTTAVIFKINIELKGIHES